MCGESWGSYEPEEFCTKAGQSLEEAQNVLVIKRDILQKLQSKPEDELIKDVSLLKAPLDKPGKRWNGLEVEVGVDEGQAGGGGCVRDQEEGCL